MLFVLAVKHCLQESDVFREETQFMFLGRPTVCIHYQTLILGKAYRQPSKKEGKKEEKRGKKGKEGKKEKKGRKKRT